MCGIAGIVASDQLVADDRARAAADARRPRASRPGRRRAVRRRPGGARPPPAEHRRSGGRASAALERRRHHLDRLQRRDLQPRRRQTRASRAPATTTAPGPTPRRSSTLTRSGATPASSSSARHVRLRHLGRAAPAAAARPRPPRHQAALLGAWPATGCCSDRRSSRCSRAASSAPEADESRLPELLSTRYLSGAETLFRAFTGSCPGTPLVFEHGTVTTREYWDVPAGRRPHEEPRNLSERDAVAAVPRQARGVRTAAPDGGRAARHVPLRRSRQQRHCRADGAHDRPAAADLLGGVQGARVQRARLRAAGVDRDRRRRARDRHRRTRLLRGAAAADLARGRADRAPVERAALFRLRARPRARQGRPDRRRQRRAAGRLRQVSASARQLASRRRLRASCRHPVRAWIADTVVPRLPKQVRRYASRSFLAMERTPEAMFFDNFAAIGLARQRTLLVAAIRRRLAGGRLRAVASVLRRAERPQHDSRPPALHGSSRPISSSC